MCASEGAVGGVARPKPTILHHAISEPILIHHEAQPDSNNSLAIQIGPSGASSHAGTEQAATSIDEFQKPVEAIATTANDDATAAAATSDNWKIPMDSFLHGYKPESELRKLRTSKKVRAFYRNQNEIIRNIKKVHSLYDIDVPDNSGGSGSDGQTHAQAVPLLMQSSSSPALGSSESDSTSVSDCGTSNMAAPTTPVDIAVAVDDYPPPAVMTKDVAPAPMDSVITAEKHPPDLDITDDVLVDAPQGLTIEQVKQRIRKREALARKAVAISFVCNVFLLFIKLAAAISTGSLSVIASTLDSSLDLLSGLILWLTSRYAQKKKKHIHHYPAGKKRMEPLGVIIFAAIMGTATLQLVKEAAQISLNYFFRADWFSRGWLSVLNVFVNIGATSDLSFLWNHVILISTAMFLITIVVKAILYLICGAKIFATSPSVQAYAQDHRNDVVTNIFLLISVFVSSVFWWTDPLAATILAFYILRSWVLKSIEQMKHMIGRAADPKFLQTITYLACNHDPRIQKLCTVRAYHFGSNYLVEVDLVLPPEMTLGEAHDIGEGLQVKLEQLEDVERAFVHLDHDHTHKPEHYENYD